MSRQCAEETKNLKGNSTKGSIENYGFGVRHIQLGCMCVTLTVMFILRSNISVAVLAMTDHHRFNETGIMIFEWDKKIQGVILGSFYYMYMVMQIPAGILAKRFGGKNLMLFAMLTNALVCALTPILVYWGGWPLMCAGRVLMGFTQSCVMPSIHTMLGRWLPAQERTAYVGIVYGGTKIGTIIALPLSGYLADTNMGWKLIFYVSATIVLATSVLWWFLAASSPGEHWMMKMEELEYIERGINLNSGRPVKLVKTPWRAILCCRPLWAISIVHWGYVVFFSLFFSDLPTYMEKALHISLKSSAILSALPYIGMWFSVVIGSKILNCLINKGYLTPLASMKWACSVAHFGVAAGLIVLCFLGPDHKTLAITTLILSLTFGGVAIAGFLANHLYLSPNFAGILLAFTNTTANIASWLTPLYTSFILNSDPTDVNSWRVVFLTVAAVAVITSIIYLMFSSAERQSWDQEIFHDKQHADLEELKTALGKEDAKIED